MLEIFRYSLGVPREVCRICDLALLSGFQRGEPTITESIIAEVAQDLLLTPEPVIEAKGG